MSWCERVTSHAGELRALHPDTLHPLAISCSVFVVRTALDGAGRALLQPNPHLLVVLRATPETSVGQALCRA